MRTSVVHGGKGASFEFAGSVAVMVKVSVTLPEYVYVAEEPIGAYWTEEPLAVATTV